MFLCNQGRSVTPNSHQISVGHKTVNKKKFLVNHQVNCLEPET